MSIRRKCVRALTAMAASVLLATGAQAAQVNIGFTGPLSGGAALYGDQSVKGMQLAAKQINDAGGFEVDGKNYTVNIVALDDKYTPGQAAVNARRLAQRERAPVIFTPHSGGIYALQAFNERDNFLIMGFTSIPQVTEKGNSLTVRIPPTFTAYLEPFAKLAMDRFGPKIAIANATHDYAKMWGAAFEKTWVERGGSVVANNPMDYNKSADFYTGVSRALAAKPDVLFIGGASEPTGLVVRQARELGFKGGFILMDQAKLNDVATVAGGIGALEGSVGVTPLELYDSEDSHRFIDLYKATYNSNATSESSYHYFSVHLTVQAMKEAGSVTDPRAIRAAMQKALVSLPPAFNPYGVSHIDDDGGLQTDPRVAYVKDGEVFALTRAQILDGEALPEQ